MCVPAFVISSFKLFATVSSHVPSNTSPLYMQYVYWSKNVTSPFTTPLSLTLTFPDVGVVPSYSKSSQLFGNVHAYDSVSSGLSSLKK